MACVQTVFFLFIPAASPPKMVSFDDLIETANGLSKLTLAHEIVMNSNFQMKSIDLPPQR